MDPEMPSNPAAPDSERAVPGRAPSRGLTRRQRTRRIIAVVVLALLAALLGYATYYYANNRALPTVEVAKPAEVIEPPRYLYSITGRGASELIRPVGVGVAADGRVYVVDFGHRRVSVFENGGRFLFSFNKVDGGSALRNPVHLVIKDSEVWVTDRRQRAIFVFDLEGKFIRRFQPKGEKLVWTPLALAFDGEKLRVTDVGGTTKHRLHFFSADASRTATVGRTYQATSLEDMPGGFFFPDGLAVSKDGRVFVSDGDNRRIQVFKPDATFDGFIDTSGIPRGVAIDAQQRLYVVDAVAHTVDIYDLDGNRLTQFGSQGFGPGQFNYPNDIALRGSRIYVTDRDNNQVQVWGWPVAQPPAIAAPTSWLGWAGCLSPFFLLPLLLLFRKRRVVVTPDFVYALEAEGLIAAVSRRRGLRLVAPEDDRPLYEGREAEGVNLGSLIEFDVHSESDTRAFMDRLDVPEREAILISMADRVRALGTTDKELRRLAVLGDVGVVDVEEFRREFLGNRRR